jgi:hypothetical protein
MSHDTYFMGQVSGFWSPPATRVPYVIQACLKTTNVALLHLQALLLRWLNDTSSDTLPFKKIQDLATVTFDAAAVLI